MDSWIQDTNVYNLYIEPVNSHGLVASEFESNIHHQGWKKMIKHSM